VLMESFACAGGSKRNRASAISNTYGWELKPIGVTGRKRPG
jgi:hypothetical protein